MKRPRKVIFMSSIGRVESRGSLDEGAGNHGNTTRSDEHVKQIEELDDALQDIQDIPRVFPSLDMEPMPVTADVPAIFTSLPPIRDLLNTETSSVQDSTVQECLPFLAGTDEDVNRYGLPKLHRKQHVEYFRDQLEDFPPGFVVLDASRPWMLYWALAGLCLLGEDISEYRERYLALSVIFKRLLPPSSLPFRALSVREKNS